MHAEGVAQYLAGVHDRTLFYHGAAMSLLNDVHEQKAAEPDPGRSGSDIVATSRNLSDWLAENRCSIAFSTDQCGTLFLVGRQQNGELVHRTLSFNRSRGVYADEGKIWIASQDQIFRFSSVEKDGATASGSERHYCPRQIYVTGDLGINEMAETAAGELLFVSTRFSCVAIPSVERSFTPVWQPDFITRLATEDRCHLNGLAMREGKPYAVTAAACTDVAQGWRAHRMAGGVVIEMASDAVICDGLSMPHSPRWAHGRLWVLDSGNGALGYVDTATGRLEEVAFCPGFARGMGIIGRYAVVGLSRPRHGSFRDLALQSRLEKHRIEARCGLIVIDLETGSVVEWLRISGSAQEVFDVALLPYTRQPIILADPRQQGSQFVDV